ncbi:MAG: hypothetical protein BGO05_27815 [Rhizobiales bacterium 63-7]|nr:MAG: hypothetical protein BGO05_27815 [Rhizobiales bacterium 63-7]
MPIEAYDGMAHVCQSLSGHECSENAVPVQVIGIVAQYSMRPAYIVQCCEDDGSITLAYAWFVLKADIT